MKLYTITYRTKGQTLVDNITIDADNEQDAKEKFKRRVISTTTIEIINVEEKQ